MSLIPPSILFGEYNVHLRLALPQYIQLIDQVILLNPQLEEEEVSSLFASAVYLFEPENRPGLKEMELDYLRGDFGTPPLNTPKLSIQDLLRETARAEN